MPLAILVVEGLGNAPEGSVLPRIVPAGCTVVLGGSKTGLADQVLGIRRAGRATVAGLRDRDFDDDTSAPTGVPQRWTAGRSKDWIGWTWERAEIENYLIDPQVVAQALGPHAPEPSAYQAALDNAARRIAAYTAARTALSRWPPFAAMANRWGDSVYGGDHRFPADLSPDACRAGIRQIVDAYEAERRVEVADVLDRFERVNAECQPGGPRFAHYLTFFSGKDLLLAMEPGLATLSLGTPRDSCSRVASCIEVAADDVALWLPEWSALRNELAQAHSKDGPSAGGV